MTPGTLRVKLWRKTNPEKYKAYQREIMKKYRAKKKAEKINAKNNPPAPLHT